MANKLKNLFFPQEKKSEFSTNTYDISTKELQNSQEIKPQQVQAKPPQIIKINSFSDVEGPANQLIMGTSIIVDVSDCELSESRRIIDFFNGVIFAIGGEVQRVAKLVYLFNPKK